MSLSSALKALEQIEGLGTKRKAKEEVLRENSGNSVLKRIIQFTYDWSLTFGYIPPDKKIVTLDNGPDSPGLRWKAFKKLLTQLATRQLTGNAAKTAVTKMLRSLNALQAKWFQRILRRDLRIGVNIGTYGKVWPELVSTFKVQLAQVYPDTVPAAFPVAVEPKLDGYRFVFVVEDGVSIAYSRNGKEYPNLSFIGDQLALVCESGVFDGEVVKDNNWNKTSSLLRTEKLTPAQQKELETIKFWAFDWIPLAGFKSGRSDMTETQRRSQLKKLVRRLHKMGHKRNVELVPRLMAPDQETVEQLLKDYVDRKYEGVMLKNPEAQYEVAAHTGGRTPHWLKYKPFEEHDCVIIDAMRGTGKNKDRLGAFRVRLESGEEAQVGGGYTDKERKLFWKNKQQYIGKTLVAKVQKDDGVAVVRFPVFVRIRDSKDE